MQDGMSAHIAVFLTEGVECDSSSWENGRGCLRIEAGHMGALLSVHGTAAEFRRVAEALHRLADDVERGVKRQRALDNAPRRRFKFVADEVTTQKEMKTAA
jgi:hypothetical protein